MTTTDLHNAAAALGHQGGLSTSPNKQRAARRNGKRGGAKKGGTKMYYAAESSMGLSMTYDSPCWMVLAFASKRQRDEYVKAHSDKAESVDRKQAERIAPQLRTEDVDKAWRVAVMQ